MRLQELRLTDFKGLQRAVFRFDGRNATLCGTNGTGKTTVADALAWLLCGRGSDPEAKSFSPKPKDGQGNELHGVDACAEGSFLLGNGESIALSKTWHEEWTARKGSTEKELTGNRTVCAIDGVPVTAGEYERRVAAICPPQRVQLLTAPLYFPAALHWQERRQVLLELCGDVSDGEVLASSPAFYELKELLRKPHGGSYTIEEWRTRAAAQLKAVQGQLRELPQRLDEVQRSLPRLPEQSEEELIREKEALSKRREALLLQAPEDRQERLLSAEETALERERAAFERQKNEELTDCRRLYADVSARRQAKQGRQLTLTVLLRGQEAELTRQRNEQTRLREVIAQTENSVFKGQSACPTCGQRLPPERVEAAQAAFARQRAEKREQLQAELNKLQPDSLAQTAEKTAGELETLKPELDALQAREQQLRAELMRIERRDFTRTEAYSTHLSRMEQLRKDAPDTAKREPAALSDRLGTLERLLTDYRIDRERQARKKELLVQEQQAKAALAGLNRGIGLCELFVTAKVSLLTERINAHFKTVRFRLFERQLNGGIRECCEVLVRTSRGWKLFADANAGARLCAGLEIIDTLGEKWGVTLPVFVDNAESVVCLPKIRAQLIRLQVSAADAELHMVPEGAANGVD